MIPLLTLSYRTVSGIAAYLIARHGADHRSAEPATAPTDKLIGAVGELGSEDGGMADIVKAGMSEVRLGGTVENGDPLTADANSKAVKAAPAAGETVAIIGTAESDGEAEDVIPYLAAPGFLSNPSA
ncbi:hypothetical protein [Martelella mediterranea]|uniref:Uncharacterized protein n=1 Tax=Martelella mediterranea TaxID=293089 RepID=A0A4R3NUK7_9HYPH|nr:hypothetical protein [Martelella mediterranea]TCT41158.1 hypothetical protein EDC90_1007135 [Martelella mediterranea]